MKKHITFIGLDVHKNSINVTLVDGDRNGDVRYYGTQRIVRQQLGGMLLRLGFRYQGIRF